MGEHTKIIKLIEKGYISESIELFLKLNEEDKVKILREEVVDTEIDGRFDPRKIIFLNELYEVYGNVYAIVLLEEIFYMWAPPFFEESYPLAAYYKKLMIENQINYKKNISELLEMSDPDYREHFDNEYMLKLGNEILRNKDLEPKIKESALKMIRHIEETKTEWWEY